MTAALAPDELLASLDLPFPPSVNHYWKTVTRPIKGGKRRPTVLVSDAGEAFRKAAYYKCVQQKAANQLFACRLGLYILLQPPDRIRRDVDNYLKSLLDALTYARVWHDDQQIDLLTIERGEIQPPGFARVEIYGLPGSQKVLTIGS